MKNYTYALVLSMSIAACGPNEPMKQRVQTPPKQQVELVQQDTPIRADVRYEDGKNEQSYSMNLKLVEKDKYRLAVPVMGKKELALAPTITLAGLSLTSISTWFDVPESYSDVLNSEINIVLFDMNGKFANALTAKYVWSQKERNSTILGMDVRGLGNQNVQAVLADGGVICIMVSDKKARKSFTVEIPIRFIRVPHE